MERMVAFSRQTGGWFTEEDFRSYAPLWAEPITTDYRGYTVCEMPPNGHGITALMALNILRGLELPAEREDARTYHLIAGGHQAGLCRHQDLRGRPPVHADPGGRPAQRGIRRPAAGR